MEAASKGSSSGATTTPVPGTLLMETNDNDVVLGRGKNANHRLGNVQFRALAVAASEAYMEGPTSEDKKTIAQGIIDNVHARGGRFLRSVTAATAQGTLTAAWEVVDEETAMGKVKQAIRDLSATARKKALARRNRTAAASAGNRVPGIAQPPDLPPASFGGHSWWSAANGPQHRLLQSQHSSLPPDSTIYQSHPQQPLLPEHSLPQQHQLELLLQLQQQQVAAGQSSSYPLTHLQVLQRLGFVAPPQPNSTAGYHPALHTVQHPQQQQQEPGQQSSLQQELERSQSLQQQYQHPAAPSDGEMDRWFGPLRQHRLQFAPGSHLDQPSGARSDASAIDRSAAAARMLGMMRQDPSLVASGQPSFVSQHTSSTPASFSQRNPSALQRSSSITAGKMQQQQAPTGVEDDPVAARTGAKAVSAVSSGVTKKRRHASSSFNASSSSSHSASSSSSAADPQPTKQKKKKPKRQSLQERQRTSDPSAATAREPSSQNIQVVAKQQQQQDGASTIMFALGQQQVQQFPQRNHHHHGTVPTSRSTAPASSRDPSGGTAQPHPKRQSRRRHRSSK